MIAEVLKFPHRRSDVIKSLLETAKRLEKTAPADCVAIQGQVIAMLSAEVSQFRRTAYEAMRALTAMRETADDPLEVYFSTTAFCSPELCAQT